MARYIALLSIFFALLCVVCAQKNRTFCYPPHYTASVITSEWIYRNGKWNDDELLTRSEQALDSGPKALRLDTSSGDTAYTLLVLYEQGLQYTWQNAGSDCEVYKFSPIPFSTIVCTTTNQEPESTTVAGVDAYLYATKGGNYTLYALLTTSGIPVSAVLNETIYGEGYVVYTYFLNVNTAAIPSSKFTPPSNCKPSETLSSETSAHASKVKSPMLPIDLLRV